MKLTKLLPSLAVVAVLAASTGVLAQSPQNAPANQFTFTSIDGTPLPLARYAGKVLLVVNTASFCGFTRQYAGLQRLWEAYETKGLVVIGVPSNDFGDQEPGTSTEIKAFCEGAFNITFPLTDKLAVRGPAAHPFYHWARQTLGERAAPRWNFHKYLVGRDGRLIEGFATSVAPDADVLVAAIEKALATPTP